MCSDIEEALMKLENLIEIKEYYKSEAQEKIKLSNYRVDKLMNLDAYRGIFLVFFFVLLNFVFTFKLAEAICLSIYLFY